MISRLLTLTALLAILLAPAASADVLWDQSDINPAGPGYFNSESGSPPFGLTWFAVNDVTVDGAGWIIESISTYYSALDLAWGDGVVEGYVNVFDKTGPLPIDGVDDPSAGPTVAMSAALNGDHFVVTASGLNIELEPGEYWVGITPIAPSGPFGPEIHLAAGALIGDPTASYDLFGAPMPMWFVFQPDTDASILIEGMFGGSTPVDETTWGSLKSYWQ